MTVKLTSEVSGKELVEDAFVVVPYGSVASVYVPAARKAMAVDWSDQTYYEAGMGISAGPPAGFNWDEWAKSEISEAERRYKEVFNNITTANANLDLIDAELKAARVGALVGRLEAKAPARESRRRWPAKNGVNIDRIRDIAAEVLKPARSRALPKSKVRNIDMNPRREISLEDD